MVMTPQRESANKYCTHGGLFVYLKYMKTNTSVFQSIILGIIIIIIVLQREATGY